MKQFIQKNALYGAFAVSLMAIVGSLYFSEIANFPPCVLCWYQRVAIYPIAVIIGVAIYKKNREILFPAFILSAGGWLVGLFHNLLYYEILPEAAAPCVAGISCTTKFIEWFGFVTIPLLAFAGSTMIFVLLLIHWRATKGEQNNNV